METKIAKWGNSLGVRLPKALVEEAELVSGDRLDVRLGPKGSILLTPRRTRPTLDDLLKGLSPKSRHPEHNWGPARGVEEW